MVVLLGIIGVALLYSSGGKSWSPWAGPQLMRLIVSTAVMLFLASVDMRLWLRYAYWFYAAMLLLLVAVEIAGHVGMGAQRWINLGFFVLQPSEMMKLALILSLARYFHELPPEDIGQPLKLLPPIMLTVLPVVLVLMQPNLGTAALLLLVAAAIIFVAGVRWWKVLAAIGAAALIIPKIWDHLHDYQKQRLLTFLNPEADPRGAGYNIMQSKIALGAGGWFGKGFGQGTQSQLQFLPEKHTDFIFVVLGEEFGLVGTLFVLCLYVLVLAYIFLIALGCRNQFARLVAFGTGINLFLYMVVNVAMVTGLIPVVGIPLPLVSYGGTAMLALMVGFGILLSVANQRDLRLSRTGIAS